MVSAIGPEAHSNQISKPLVPWACGNEQRLTKDVTPSPCLEDLRQRPRMPGHASYSSLGHHTDNPSSHHTRVPLRVDPPYQVTKWYSPSIRVSKHQGEKPEESPPVNSTRCNHQGERKRIHPRGSHLRGCTTESYQKWLRRKSPTMTTTE